MILWGNVKMWLDCLMRGVYGEGIYVSRVFMELLGMVGKEKEGRVGYF